MEKKIQQTSSELHAFPGFIKEEKRFWELYPPPKMTTHSQGHTAALEKWKCWVADEIVFKQPTADVKKEMPETWHLHIQDN